MEFLYACGINGYMLLLRLLDVLGHARAKKFVEKRIGVFEKIKKEFKVDKKCVWFHFASLGEYEQGSPVMDYFLKADYKIVITFFSPSGYEIRKKNPYTEYTYYLPMDSSSNAKNFLNLIQPNIAVFTKYEFWHFYFKELEKRNIPLYLISGLFRENQLFFKGYGGFYRNMLRKIKFIFVQNESSKTLLNGIGINNVEVAGDTRFDKVLDNYRHKKSLPIIEKFLGGQKAIVLGSSWKAEEELMLAYLNNNTCDKKIIICPHDISPNNIQRINNTFSKHFRVGIYSELESELKSEFREMDILLVDTIGVLKYIYQYSEIAFIGGAFGAGLHNILEALVFKNQILFGPKHSKFPEAREVLDRQIAYSVSNLKDLEQAMERIQAGNDKAEEIQVYIDLNKNASEKIWKKISQLEQF